MQQQEPTRPLFTFVDHLGAKRSSLTAGELAADAVRIAAMLARWKIGPGERVLLVYPPSLEVIRAFVGCLAAGVVPVPAYPVDPLRPERGLETLAAIAASSGACAALTNGEYARYQAVGTIANQFSRAKGQGPPWPDIPWHRTDQHLASTGVPAGGCEWHRSDASAVAFLQYTSGATGPPKGVAITHGNLMAELNANAGDLGFDASSRLLSWVPLYHALGLISGVCSALYGNGHLHFMSPQTFIARPRLWFDVASSVRATHLTAPNFALDLMVRKSTAPLLARWDLSSVKVLLSAGEPIRPGTVQAFYKVFGPCGLRAHTFRAAYGLAEHTGSVTVGGDTVAHFDRKALARGEVRPRAPGARGDAVALAGHGRVTKRDAHVRIVDPLTHQPCPPDAVGEIWIDSPTKAHGYFGVGAATRDTFHARLAGDPREYLRTGDLGFFHDDELFIAGRIQDHINVRGRKLYPQDLEDSVRDCHPLIRPGGVVSFVGTDDTSDEALVLLVESRKDDIDVGAARAIATAVRKRLASTYRIACHAVVVGRRGIVSKTTSGKVRRSNCRQAWLSNELLISPKTIHVDLRAAAPAD